MDEAERLAQLVANRDLGAHEIVGHLEDLETVEGVEALRSLEARIVAQGIAHTTRQATRVRARAR